MAPKQRDGDVIVAFSGQWISWAHTLAAYTAFLGALATGLCLHYHKIVQNEYYGYPQEWFPSVSSTIGDRYPERAVFQLFIAITSGPRFALVFLWYCLTARGNSSLPQVVAGTGLFRTITCGGWTYVTSTDDHGWHDIFMISYLVATIPWTAGCLILSPKNDTTIRYRKIFAGLFFGTLVPLIYFFIQHKVHKVPGAYTIYAFFEWALVLFDVAFDAVTALDFQNFDIVVRDVKGISRGNMRVIDDRVYEKDKPIAQALEQPFSMDDALDALADCYNSFVFWSMLTSLPLTIWYFPLWFMGLSGFEAFVISSCSPLLLTFSGVRSLVVRNITIVHLMSLSGLLAFLITRPVVRLTLVSFGVGMACLAWSASLYRDRQQPARLQNGALTFGMGLILSSMAKFAFNSNNPIWPIMHAANGGWNYLGAGVALVAILRLTRRARLTTSVEAAPKAQGSMLLAALGLAGLLFGMHFLLGDSSTMIFWGWEGYPVRGPIAVTGVVTIVAMSAGLYAGVFHPDTVTPLRQFLMVAFGAALLTIFKHWIGYLGGLTFAFALMSLTPSLLASATRFDPGLTFGLTFLFYIVMELASIWTVAYAFVPGGPLLRERTDYVMTAMVMLIGAGILALPDSNTSNLKGSTRSRVNIKSSYHVYILMAMQLLAASTAYLRFPTNDYQPYHADDKVITAAIWTIHFAIDNDMWSSEHRMRDVIKELEVDVIGLLESDNQRIIMGNRDATQFLAEDLGMYADFGPGPNKHTWGAALLSKFPILNSTHHLLPSPVGELAPAIHATLDAYGELIDVVVFHSGQEEDAEDRRLQSEYLAKLMRESPHPTILMSYLVTKPKEGNYHTYVGEKSGMRDIDPSDWDRWCEYILYKGIQRTGYARVSRSTITDTEIQVGKFVVGQPEGSDEMVPEDQVPAGRRFPELFKGQGVRGHQYHVFDAPRYFA